MKRRHPQRAFLPAALVIAAFLSAVANAAAEPTNANAKARVPIIEFRLRPAPNFDPADPVIIKTIINASDDVTTSHLVPEHDYDWIAMGPEMVLFDGEFSEEGSDLAKSVGTIDMMWGKPRELPPRKARELAFHLRDQFRIPPGWTNLWLKEESGWISLDRKGRVVPMPKETQWALGPSDRVANPSATGNYEVIERLEAPVQPPDPKVQAAENARRRWRIAAGALGAVLVIAGLASRLWCRRHRGQTAG